MNWLYIQNKWLSHVVTKDSTDKWHNGSVGYNCLVTRLLTYHWQRLLTRVTRKTETLLRVPETKETDAERQTVNDRVKLMGYDDVNWTEIS
jgi:hypothetical protein